MGKPNIRFKGYTEDWEQRKLGDFGKATGGTSIESEFSEDGIYKVISIGSYSENSVYNDQGIRAIKSDKTSNRVLNRNDLTMILNDKTTSGNIIGRVLLIEESGIYVYNQRTERIEINLDEYDPVFLYEMLNAPNIREKIIKQAQGNTQIYVNWTAISLLEYMIPSKEEQVKIGEYLHSISNLITLHQRKYDETKKLKKCMLQKMFPKEGEKVPEIRFSGFTGDWKQRKLGEIIEVCSGRDYKHLEKGNVPVYGTGGYMLSVSKALSADKDAVGIGRKGTIDKPYILKAPFWTVDTLFYCVSKKDCDLNFIFDIFQNINWKALDESTGVPSLSKAVINKVKVLIPSVVEQIKIGRYFSLLDNRITFHHRKSNLFNKTCRNAWEQRKLGDFGKATGGTSIESEFSEDGIYKVISIGSYSENSVYNDQGIRAIKSDKTSNRVLNRNDLTMILNDKTTSGNIIGRVLLIEESGIYVYNQRTERIEINLDEYDPVFLYEMLNAPNIREKIIKQAQGNTQIYVNWTAISLLEYMIPSKEEQVKIGEYLHSISNLITLHQQKCKQLQIIRKFMLQNIFL